MKTQTYTLDELCQLADVNVRTARFYIQKGLVPGPEGKNRGARYFPSHLQKLLEIKKWQSAGLSLERIAEILQQPDDPHHLPLKRPQPGSLEVWTHIIIDDGIELQVEPARSGLTSSQIRELSQQILELYKTIKTNDVNNKEND
ncbi:MerR family transcriptional regulator [Agarilytica rhodophyticola]|uniref:MerR family transcriptional regulator n=1 Tax=Agarilytica rhodophyticola TaxID=1737490 RepID=UPI000B341BFE|nr:MerR family transcriptional regulator [Agarilytica rhodophyticola]